MYSTCMCVYVHTYVVIFNILYPNKPVVGWDLWLGLSADLEKKLVVAHHSCECADLLKAMLVCAMAGSRQGP